VISFDRWRSPRWSSRRAEGNRIAVLSETTSLDALMKVFSSPATAEAMALDGIKRETVKMFVLDKELKL
jgi:hypothetical protein